MKKRYAIALAISLLGPSVYAADAGPSQVETMKESIVKLLSTITLEFRGTENLKFCRAFLKNFQKQTQIKHIEPLIQTDNYQDPRLEVYKRKCPKLALNKRVTFKPGDFEGIKTLPEEERDQYGDVYYGTKNFKLYRLGGNDKKPSERDYVFYYEKWVSKQDWDAAAGNADVLREATTYGGGQFTVVDFETCTTGSVVPVDQFRGFDKRPAYSGVIQYDGRYYVFDLRPAGTSLVLWEYQNDKSGYGFGSGCGFYQTRPEKPKSE